MTNEILKEELMTDTELDLIAGGKGISWYYRPESMKMEDENTPGKMNIVKGYIVDGEVDKTGEAVASRFFDKPSFEKFRKNHADDRFYRGALRIGTAAAA